LIPGFRKKKIGTIKVYEIWPGVGWGFVLFWVSLDFAVSSKDFVFTAAHDLLTCSKNVAVKVSFVFVVWKEPCK